MTEERKFTGPAGQTGSQRGSALLVVLMMLGTIGALAAIAARSVSSAAVEMAAFQRNARNAWDLRTGIELGVAAIQRLGERVRSAEASLSLADRRIQVRITNERARIDLNAASQAAFSALLKASGVLDSENLAHSLVEWRGGSTARPAAGARGGQSGMFAAADSFELRPDTEFRKAPAQGVAARFFLHPFQLRSVPGFSASLVDRLLPLITVANGTGQVDPFVATRAVLMALPGTSPATVDAFVEARETSSAGELAIKLLGVAPSLMNSRAAPGWRLEISSTGGGRTYRCEAVVALLEGDSQPYRVLYVRDVQ